MRFLLVCFLCAFTFQSFAQKKKNPLPENVSLAKELKEKYEEADIAIKSRTTKVTFKRNKQSGKLEALVRDKINLVGISSSARIQYPVFYDSESKVERFMLRSNKGRDITAVVKDEAMKSEDLFHTDYRVKYTELSFPLQGYNRMIEIEKRYTDSKYFTSLYFSDHFPVVEGKLIVTIPSWLELDIKEFNFEGYTIEKSEKTSEGNSVITYTYKELDERSKKKYSLGPSYLYPHVLFIAKAYKSKEGTVNLFSNTEDLFAWYNSLVESVEIDSSVYTDKVKELVAGVSSDEEKIKNIYYWVQDNIRYIAFEDGIAGFKPDSPQNVFTKRYGDCKGMAILTKNMLQEAGFDARLVWIGTDRLAYDYSIPSLSVDNHMIAAVVLNGETIFLDGTEKYNRFGEYATRIQNKEAMMQDGDSFKIIKVPAASGTGNRDKAVYNLRVNDESLLGTATRTFSGETRVSFQNSYQAFGGDEKLDRLSGYLGGSNQNFFVDELKVSDEEDRENDLSVDFVVQVENSVTEFDGVLYLEIDPTKQLIPQIDENRSTPFLHYLKEAYITEVNLTMPEGYSKAELPEGLSISNDLLDINLSYQQQGNSILYKNEITLKKRVVDPAQFELWNETFEALKEQLNQQITLNK
ncbi:transglutaminase-like domain-containing protein [Aureisphaera galaxeae]|uniref:transglutaminase-like domain-containing protein n=1 Tax=Aureisphaera galaxeae TaxID=1538023 RepID=UPI00234FC540|nr:transglutaminase-like domain-containing protein [Aureisphaera galaxeae]MDC8003643.1 transglutaminase-like domain-containing protein [Aureisphaera galaxeae]